MRRVRSKALRAQGIRKSRKSSSPRSGDVGDRGSSQRSIQYNALAVDHKINVEMRPVNDSIFIHIKPFQNPPYRIYNRSINYTIFFRQRGSDGHPWNSLAPGEHCSFLWEEPMKPKKLSVRVGFGIPWKFQSPGHTKVHPDAGKDGNRKKKWNVYRKFFKNIEGEEQFTFGANRTIKLEEIGCVEYLPCPKDRFDKHGEVEDLVGRVDTDGERRVLLVSDYISDSLYEGDNDELKNLQNHVEHLKGKIRDEQNKLHNFQEIAARMGEIQVLNDGVRPIVDKMPTWHETNDENELDEISNGANSGVVKNTIGINSFDDGFVEPADAKISMARKAIHDCNDMHSIEHIATKEIADYAEGSTISNRFQVSIEILEAADLKPADLSGFSNPYCEIILTHRKRKKRGIFLTKAKQKTYFVEKTLFPEWNNQVFVFDTPMETHLSARGFSVLITMKSHVNVGSELFLGQAEVQLRSLKSQTELVGWYPLVGRTGKMFQQSSENVRGSIKLKLQWIYTVPALVSYFLLLSERRLKGLKQIKNGMETQMKSIKDTPGAKTSTESFNLVSKSNQLNKKKVTRERSGPRARNGTIADRFFGGRKAKEKAARKEALVYELLKKTAQSRRSRNSIHTIGEKHAENDLDSKQSFGASLEKLTFQAAQNDTFSSLHDAASVTLSNEANNYTDLAKLSPHGNNLLRPRLLSELSFGTNEYCETSLARTFSYNDASNNPDDDFAPLLRMGLLFHEVGINYFHCRHFSAKYSILRSNESLIKALPSKLSQIYTWIEAQVFLNDSFICERLLGASRHEPLYPKISRLAYIERDVVDGKLSFAKGICQVPQRSTSVMKYRSSLLAQQLELSRISFSRAAQRSLLSAINEGGWLTICPIAALNLGVNAEKMYIKLKYGDETLSSKSVDGRAIWANADVDMLQTSQKKEKTME